MCYCCICSVSDFALYIIALIFPPVAVLLRSGFASADLLLNVLLTLLGFFPGLIHAFYYITMTSPLRGTVQIYEQRWSDVERNGQQQRRVYESANEMRMPLISNNNNNTSSSTQNNEPLEGNSNLTVKQALDNQKNHKNGTNTPSITQDIPPPPPPYKE